MSKTIIIAEIGECFNGDLDNAKKLIDIAREAGCDIAKFQTLDYDNINPNDPEREWFEKISLDLPKIKYLVDYGKSVGIKIMFTPENVKTARWILEVGLKAIKIASSTMADLELVKFINDNFDIVFISTGMATLEEVDAAVAALNKIKELYILHCISEYPTGPLLEERGLKALSSEDVHLQMMTILKERFPKQHVGYSDHTDGILAPIIAVAMGAAVIEKHVTLDRKTPVENYKNGKAYLGTDHILSLEPDELRAMVKQIREVEKMLGEKRWERTEGEKILRTFLRGRFQNANARS